MGKQSTRLALWLKYIAVLGGVLLLGIVTNVAVLHVKMTGAPLTSHELHSELSLSILVTVVTVVLLQYFIPQWRNICDHHSDFVADVVRKSFCVLVMVLVVQQIVTPNIVAFFFLHMSEAEPQDMVLTALVLVSSILCLYRLALPILRDQRIFSI